MIGVNTIPYSALLQMAEDEESNWSIVSAVNYEECASTITRDFLSICLRRRGLKIRFCPFRLFSRRTSPWSPLEIVRDSFQDELEALASDAGISFDVANVEYPVGPDIALEILSRARGKDTVPPKLVLDLSAIPREMAVYICDTLIGDGPKSWPLTFDCVYLAHTPPERITSRQGLGPFSVGGIKCVYSPELIRRQPDSMKNYVVIFPGYEGFEAKAAVDALVGHQAMITVAVNCFEGSFPKAMELLIGNQALVADSVEGKLELQYYYSEEDALRIALDVVDRAVNVCKEYPRVPHTFLAAPFGPKWSVAVSCIARKMFLRHCSEMEGVYATTDVLLLPAFQYVSLYSRGAKTPHILAVSSRGEIE